MGTGQALGVQWAWGSERVEPGPPRQMQTLGGKENAGFLTQAQAGSAQGVGGQGCQALTARWAASREALVTICAGREALL